MGLKRENKVVGLILAAGYSSRMGAFKPLLPIGDMTAVERISAALKQAGIHNIIGVTGFQREQLRAVFMSEGIAEAYNQDFEQGMFTSVKTGIRAVLNGRSTDTLSLNLIAGFLLMLVDCPLVPSEVIELILEKHRENPDAFIVPSYGGKNGHPLFIPAQYAEEILAYEGENGLKAIRNRHSEKLIRLEVDTEAVLLDMDTREGYEEVLEYYNSQLRRIADAEFDYEEGLNYEEVLHGKRLFLIRHGEIKQHKDKIFLGQTDAPLSEKGRAQAKEAAGELSNFQISVNRIYTSDLSRAAETAEIIKRSLDPDIEVIREPKLREMSLGEWDGRYINEIKDQFPDEYQKRGENLLAYKFGNDSENFYDLQYRVMKGFRTILMRERETGDNASDILIVAHQGVIQVMLSSLRQRPLEEEMRNLIPNGGSVVIDYSKTK
ncbi:MAG TPA: histidine phosphatase family protein [Anaerovoracaceae bacterium]|nr:histidine phosphatase family protein [Anaerovoracaceae bacterium]